MTHFQHLLWLRFRTFGSMFVAAAAWLYLSSQGWRFLTFLTAVPVTISSIISVFYLPESPRWLVVEGRVSDAERVLRDAAIANGTPLSPFVLSNKSSTEAESPSVIKLLSELVKGEVARVSVPLWIAWLSFGFCYFGVILFVTKVFEADSDADDDDALTCDFDYQSIFVSATSEIVGIFLAAYIIEKWGRVPSQVSMFALAGLGVFCMGIRMTDGPLICISIFARLTAVAANSSVWVITPELYTTELRATGHSVANCFARVGAFLSPFLVENRSVSHMVIGLVLALMNFVGVCAALCLPETLGKKMSICC
jgi:MFS transporter, putative metabolite:H+ symporter